MAFDPRLIDDLARRLAGSVPESVVALRRDLEQNFKGVLSGGLAKLDLVTREEFDVQAAVLKRTRAKLAALEKRIAVLESRADLGGTWDLFRYPGARSDSDMFTFGYRIRPWRGLVSMVDGTSIREYVRATAVELGVLPLIRFNRRVTHLAWSSAEALWTVTVHETQPGDERGAAAGPAQTIRARFVHLCTGYYHYAEGYRPEFPGEADFRGRFVHPQRWPQDLDHSGKRIVVIGSGATAVTLVPELAKTAAHVTQLQRSPTYVVSQPAEDRIARSLSSLLPAPLLFPLVRWKNILYAVGFERHKLARAQALAKRGARLTLLVDSAEAVR